MLLKNGNRACFCAICIFHFDSLSSLYRLWSSCCCIPNHAFCFFMVVSKVDILVNCTSDISEGGWIYPPKCLWAGIMCSKFLCRSNKLLEIPHITPLELYAEVILASCSRYGNNDFLLEIVLWGTFDEERWNPCPYSGSSLCVKWIHHSQVALRGVPCDAFLISWTAHHDGRQHDACNTRAAGSTQGLCKEACS